MACILTVCFEVQHLLCICSF